MVDLVKGKNGDEQPPERRGISLAKPAATPASPSVPEAGRPAGHPIGPGPLPDAPRLSYPPSRPPAPGQPNPVPVSGLPPAGNGFSDRTLGPLPAPVVGSDPWYRRGSALALLGAALGLIVVLVAVGVVNSSRNRSPATAGAPVPQPTAESTTESASESASLSPDPSESSVATSSSSPAPAVIPPVTPAGITIAALRSDPHIGPVADLFDRYFTATNAHDASGLPAIFDPAGVTKSDDPDGVATWEAAVATSFDDQVTLDRIRPDPQVAGGLLVHASFRSQQDPSLGPHGQSCTRWDMVFRLTPYTTGYRVYGAQQVHAVAC